MEMPDSTLDADLVVKSFGRTGARAREVGMVSGMCP